MGIRVTFSDCSNGEAVVVYFDARGYQKLAEERIRYRQSLRVCLLLVKLYRINFFFA